jgi:CheY-like chemotaxis protein/two-component sensor histidine kinase
LAGGVAHDFNNLLTVINSTAELAARSLPPASPLHTDLADIQQAGDRAAALTRQLLAFSRKQIMQPTRVELGALVGNLKHMLRRMIGEQIAVAVIGGETGCVVRADPGQLEQVVLNLAVNSRDAMPHGGALSLETRSVHLDAEFVAAHPAAHEGAYVVLAVSDTGTGMSEETKRHIFEPFFTTKETGKGTGLGLATVYGIVEQLGGFVTVESELGVGTTVRIYLPQVMPTADHEPRQSQAASLHGGSETVLVVEDENAVRRLAQRILAGAGYTVLMAVNGAHALKVLADYPGDVHLVITDVVMPGMNGSELAAHLEATGHSPRILFTSGYTDDELVQLGVTNQSVAFLAKPYSARELLDKARQELDRPASRAAGGSAVAS